MWRCTLDTERERFIDSHFSKYTNCDTYHDFREFCQKTTAHGFSHVVEKDIHIIMRIFWVVVTFVRWKPLVTESFLLLLLLLLSYSSMVISDSFAFYWLFYFANGDFFSTF